MINVRGSAERARSSFFTPVKGLKPLIYVLYFIFFCFMLTAMGAIAAIQRRCNYGFHNAQNRADVLGYIAAETGTEYGLIPRMNSIQLIEVDCDIAFRNSWFALWFPLGIVTLVTIIPASCDWLADLGWKYLSVFLLTIMAFIQQRRTEFLSVITPWQTAPGTALAGFIGMTIIDFIFILVIALA